MRRRQFIAGLAGATLMPHAGRGQQSTTPVIGLLSGQLPAVAGQQLAAFYQGLNDAGFVEGRNLRIESRWADNDYSKLRPLAADLVERKVALIAAIAHGATPATLAAQAVTTTTPIVFVVGGDPVKATLVSRMNRPGSNVTGATFFVNELTAKRLGLLHELLPKARSIAVLVNRNFPDTADQLKDAEAAARTLGLQIHPLHAGTEKEIDDGFAALATLRPDALFVGADPFLSSRQDRIIALAARQALPAIYELRLATAAGGLISYGTNSLEAHRWAGEYAGRILKGEKPGDLPVLQPTKFELVINLKTAKVLNLEIPAQLLARADEVIE